MNTEVSISSATDVLLVLLYAPGISNKEGEPIHGITRLEKLMFLLEKETSFKEIINKNYKFDAYDYGPFSSEIFDDIESLKSAGILNESKSGGHKLEYIDFEENEMNVYETISSSPSIKKYELTPKGIAIGKILFESLSDIQKKEILRIKSEFNSNSMSINKLLSYVYRGYPDFTKKSVIRNQILHSY